MILQLQNHMGFRFGSSWGVAKKISKLPSWRGLLKNHAHLQFTKNCPVIWKFHEFGSGETNFKITLVRNSHEHPNEQMKQIVKAKSNAVSDRSNQPTNQPTILVNTSEQAMQSKSKSCRANLRTSHRWADQPADGPFIAVILVSCWHQQSNNQAESKEKQANKQSSEQAKQSK